MPLIAPILDLVVGLAIRFTIWLVVAAAKLVARFVWSAITEHPGFTFLGVLVARDAGWITSPWGPFALAALGVLAIVRFFTSHPPTEVARQVRQETRKAYEAGAAVTGTGRKAGRWVADRFHRDHEPDLPPPPAAIPLGPVAEVR
jgi:hypothetical protein